MAIPIVTDPQAAGRVKYGAALLARTLESIGLASAQGRIVIGRADSRSVCQLQLSISVPGRESFVLKSCTDGTIAVIGGDDSGVLYGCLELAGRLRQSARLPADLHFADAPVFVMRGACIGMQKTSILPGRRVYEYPYTPELFPFFYDTEFWQQYLDFLLQNRMNALYLWNGHPFASLVKLPDYPYALEVTPDVFEKNAQMFRWIAQQADQRGIRVVQMFYNIILSKPLAEHHGIETQLAAPTPLACDYMRQSIAEFVRQYPNVGLMVCLGEALQGIENQVQWTTQVVLPGIRDGMKAAGLTQEPPVVFRTHATDARVVIPEVLKLYRNVYTEAKFNGESLTTWEPRGIRQQVHLAMSKAGAAHIVNVHILANLEPFRYGAQRFIKKCMIASRNRLGACGLHLYPLAYWNWPDAPDKTDVPLKQIERDWIWFEAWARYAWNPDIDDETDRAYWIARLAEMYGTTDAAAHILDACNDAGECAPRILRRFGITEGNRQTLSLGMTLDELVDPEKYRPFPELWESQSPPGERLAEYVEKEWNKKPHEGETPPQIISEVLDYSRCAVDAIEAAAPHVTKNRGEFARLRNDVHCIRAMSQFYAAKATAAVLVLRHRRSKNLADMERTATFLAESVQHYRRLADLTRDAYHFANSMQTNMRKIPVTGAIHGKPVAFHWTQLVGLYESELTEFQQKLSALKAGQATEIDEATIRPLPKAPFRVLSSGAEPYEVQVGAGVFTDRPLLIQSLAPELQGLTGIRFSHEQAASGGYVPIEFESPEPVRVLIGYLKSSDKTWLQVPDLETDALADERGGAEPVLLNAATIDSLPPLDVHAFNYDSGKQKLLVRGKGSFVVLGVVPQSAQIVRRDARRSGGR